MTDLYLRLVLTVIAGCLLVLTFRSVEPVATAQGPLRCTGEVKANSFGGSRPMIGGYRLEVTCR